MKVFHSVLVFCFFKLSVYLTYIEYIMRNAGLEQAQAGITIAQRNLNNLRYADISLMAESERRSVLSDSLWPWILQARILEWVALGVHDLSHRQLSVLFWLIV